MTRLCPFMSATGPTPCVEDACRLWMIQHREYEDGRREDFSDCSINVQTVTLMRLVTEQIRTTATLDNAKEALMEVPRTLGRAMVMQRILP